MEYKCKKCRFYKPLERFKAGTGPHADLGEPYQIDEKCTHPSQKYHCHYIGTRCTFFQPKEQLDLTAFMPPEDVISK